jgi:hypothetical protein
MTRKHDFDIVRTQREARAICHGDRYERCRDIVFRDHPPCAICGSGILWNAAPRTPWSPSCDHIEPWTVERQIGKTRAEAKRNLLDPAHCRAVHFSCNSRTTAAHLRQRAPGTRGFQAAAETAPPVFEPVHPKRLQPIHKRTGRTMPYGWDDEDFDHWIIDNERWTRECLEQMTAIRARKAAS